MNIIFKKYNIKYYKMDNILESLYNYFNIDLKSSLGYSDTFLFPTTSSEDLISFDYKDYTCQFASILYNNKDITDALKSNLKSLFDTIYENLSTINLIFYVSSFNIKLNFVIILPKEIYSLILPHLPSGKTVESWSKVSKYFNSLVTRGLEDKYTNHLWTLIKLSPDKPWDWFWISRNPNITWDIIKSNPEKPWNWVYVSRNPNITMDIVKDNPDKPWNWAGISRNPNLIWWMVYENQDKPWDWEGISDNTFGR